LVGAYFLFHEVLVAHQLIGMGLIFMGIIITQHRHRAHMDTRTLFLLSVFVLCVGMGQVAERYLSQHMNIYLYLGLAYCIPSGILFTIQYMRQKKPLVYKRRTFLAGLLVASTLAVGSVLLMRAIQYAPTATQPSIVSQSRVIITVILAALFLQERTHLYTKLLSAMLCVCGLILLK
jgi:drug/metabolite transporter (DMT)-like permease